MLTRVEVYNSQGVMLPIPFTTYDSGYIMAGIDGLDPVKATIVSSNFASMDGEQYQSSRREKRNIIMRLGLDVQHPSKSIRELRNSLYGFFMPKANISLRFFDTSGTVVDIGARVESFDSALFVKDPEATISLLSMDPDFYSQTPHVLNGTSVITVDEVSIDYGGTVPTGIQFQMNLTQAISGVTIYHRTSANVTKTMDIDYPMVSGDILKINTNSGAKGVVLNSASIDIPILFSLSTTSSWIDLEPGLNYIRVVVDGVGLSPYVITYYDKFGGL